MADILNIRFRPGSLLRTERLTLDELARSGQTRRAALLERLRERHSCLYSGTLTHTLRKLKSWGLVTVHGKGKGMLVRPTPEGLQEIRGYHELLKV